MNDTRQSRIRWTTALLACGAIAGPLQLPNGTAIKKMRQRRMVLVLSSSLVILALSGLLTLIGMPATLWHMAWWIAVGFGVMVLLCFVLVILAITSQPPRLARGEGAKETLLASRDGAGKRKGAESRQRTSLKRGPRTRK